MHFSLFSQIKRVPQHGKGCWAPAFRHHAGRFWIYYPDPEPTLTTGLISTVAAILEFLPPKK